jgi:hypothetical protein
MRSIRDTIDLWTWFIGLEVVFFATISYSLGPFLNNVSQESGEQGGQHAGKSIFRGGN